ncbi:hypothetical protein WK11_28675 [Burkholderia ubonensis]|uniref:Phosphoadenosine phosphosulphate reductase domain-containing protein n=2 Tax=Burkholderia ubonensis TaxID=101571 RepID=A0ABD4E9W4_9BURK|nr:hypothetical protein WJ68_33885 [Burkholderia ubonensis]KVN94471.1 hypothetical protein WJ71_33530 [Burkholderia ubonensis]KVO15949.1 hypothetical protein WJ72_10470 [Burkholderia ubonensis]KVO74359.1 hypothetical protein WJ80_29340 [Burkholderia ubonensis]KVR15259.1 hypothetical protein WK11_28675 [Burkholderia ubonensis]
MTVDTIKIYRGCDKCGMPLHYDAIMSGDETATIPASGLCGHCSGLKPGRKAEYEKEPDYEWLLDAMIDVVNGERRLLRKGASLVSSLPLVNRSGLGVAAGILDSIPAPETRSTYDAMVLYSGGKDSTYMLINLAEKGLKVCAWMLDPGYQSPQTIDNAKRITARLGVELVIDKADKTFADSLFRSGFDIDENSDIELKKGAMTYGSACWPCFSVIAVSASRFANSHRIPLCFIGTQKGQNRLNLEGSGVLSSKQLPKLNELVRKFVDPFKKAIPDQARMLQPDPDSVDFPTVLVPFYELVQKPDKEAQIRYLEERGWVMPKNTGACSSNCMINELGRAVMRSKFGFDLYQVIDANERRLGHRADQAAYGTPDPKMVKLGAVMLGLSDRELKQLGVQANGEDQNA